MFISDENRYLLMEANKLIKQVFNITDFNFKEYPCLITAIDSLDKAINKKKDYIDNTEH